ncbi:PLP-dependent aminotransferase family protein [Roseomonas sp. GC11]|uniref:MocR-like pyridoxine biosynthesis transcription factor PdxR n=1 Tax=Roseomonas sp. GC11 TaxID=2950546 RepID=UPI00210954B9|nr:PLP-dependent aminotransferase family protein [Roseomonas sp. GC11]MCQ4162388.1 PLP-dependent aminotransferase family protein [Roseomonas sp. GC11]
MQRLVDRLCADIRGRIASGLLPPGASLPSTRALAAEWGVSRTTVTAAYDQLIAEGYLQARQGARTRVAAGLGATAPAGDSQPPPHLPPPLLNRLSAYGARLGSVLLPPVCRPELPVADFRHGDLSAADFPRLAWRKAITAALLRRPPSLRYDDPAGTLPLRRALQGYLWRARGLRCEPGQIIVVNGSQQGLDLCARLLVDPGARVVMENPGYPLARLAFLAAGAEIAATPVDAEGLRTEALPPARLAYTTPSHQYPLGGVLSAARRRALLAWAGHCGAYVIEDDYDSEYRFETAPIPPLQAIDDAERVIYLGTVSKTLSPTLRLGYLVVPPPLAEAFTTAKRLADRHTPSLEQAALATMIETGAYERHIRRVRRRNGERRAALLVALEEAFGARVTVAGAAAGLHVVLWFRDLAWAEEGKLIEAAGRAGVGVYPLSPLLALAPGETPPAQAGLVIGYASMEEKIIRRGVATLAGVVGKMKGDFFF